MKASLREGGGERSETEGACATKNFQCTWAPPTANARTPKARKLASGNPAAVPPPPGGGLKMRLRLNC